MAGIALVASFSILPLFLSAAPASEPGLSGSVWVASHHTLSRIAVDTGQITQVVPVPYEVSDVAVDATRDSLWVLAHKHLYRLDSKTNITLEVDLGALAPGLDDPRTLKLNPYDGSLWVVAKKGLLRLDAQGVLQLQWKAPDEIKDASLALDETLWVLTGKSVVRLSPQGVNLQTFDFRKTLSSPRQVVVDSPGGVLWLVSEHAAARWLLNDLSLPGVALSLPSGKEESAKIRSAGINPFTGMLFLATRESLLRFDRAGVLLGSTDLRATGIDEMEAMAFEPVSQHWWLAGHKQIVRLGAAGELIAVIPVSEEVEAIGVGAPAIMPALALIEPGDGVLIRNPMPPIRYQLGVLCSGQPCDPGQAYLAALAMKVRLNDQTVGSAFVVSGNVTSFVPKERLPEGRNALEASVVDAYGHSSPSVTSAFTIDTIAPKFLALSPADNSTALSQPVEIRGNLDDATATIALERLMELGASVLDASPDHFAFRVPLKPGPNTFTLVARDPAGNESRAVLHITYAQSNATITSIAPGAVVASDFLSVSGTVEGPPNTGVTVNGVVAMVMDGRFYANRIPLKPGANELVVVAALPDGSSSTQIITITSTATSPFEITVEPQAGIAPLKTAFKVETRRGQAIQLIEADFNGDGAADFSTTNPAAPIWFTYTAPGVYQARVTVIDTQNVVTTETLYVVVYDPAERDRFFIGLWNGMNDALKRGDSNAALNYLNAGAKAKFTPVFDLLLPQMPAIIASYSPPLRVSVSESIGEYAVTRPYQGKTRVYLIYYLQDADGVWRLDEM